MDQNVEESFNNITSQSQTGNSALQLRLETTQLIENVELFLRGAKIVIQQKENGDFLTKHIETGSRKCNDAGIQSILQQVSNVINPSVVQGNFPSDSEGHSTQFEKYVIRIQQNLASNILNNLYNWEINEDDYDIIIDTIMDLIEPFMTRLIDNKERESYIPTMRYVETNNNAQPQGGFNVFGK